MRRKLTLFIPLALLLVILIIILINPPRSSNILPTQHPNQQTTQSSPVALSTCRVTDQASAMRPGSIPVWDNLGISTCYQLELSLSPEADSFPAKATITTTNLSDTDFTDLVFNLFPNAPLIYGGAMEISDITFNGQKTEPSYLLNGIAVKITPPQPIKPGQTAVIHFEYTLRLPRDFGSQWVYGVLNYNPEGPLLAFANWYPILAYRQGTAWVVHQVDGIGDAVTSDTALFLVEITASKEWKIAATGKEVLSPESEGKVIHRFFSGPTRDFMIVASPSFTVDSVIVDGMTIYQWGLPVSQTGWSHSLNVAKSSVNFFDNRYGHYPFSELDIVSLPLNLATGVEYPGLVLISQKSYQPNPNSAAELTVVIAHEIAHQWWYSVVGNNVTDYPWQDEALTTYSTYDFIKSFDSGLYQYLQNSYKQRVDAHHKIYGLESFAQPVSAFITRPSAYSTLVYVKGALFFEALSNRIGDASFNSALQSYFSKYAYQIASPSALLSSFEASCACDLKTLFQDWWISTMP